MGVTADANGSYYGKVGEEIQFLWKCVWRYATLQLALGLWRWDK